MSRLIIFRFINFPLKSSVEFEINETIQNRRIHIIQE